MSTLSANGTFTFDGTAANNAAYAVTVSARPTGQEAYGVEWQRHRAGASVSNVSVDSPIVFQCCVTVSATHFRQHRLDPRGQRNRCPGGG